MFHVYFLQSIQVRWFYIGCTSMTPIDRLSKYHNKKIVRSTMAKAPFNLIYFESYSDKSTAFKREYYLKTPAGYQEKLAIVAKYEIRG